MSTLETVYNIYDTGLSSAEDNPVKPIHIGHYFPQIPITMNGRYYIVPGHECPICMDPIIRKSDAFLTACGHAFHKICIFNAYTQKMFENNYTNFTCPICRSKLGNDIEYINERYRENNGNGLDILENFWIKQPFILPTLCPFKQAIESHHHPIGLNSTCHNRS